MQEEWLTSGEFFKESSIRNDAKRWLVSVRRNGGLKRGLYMPKHE